MRKKPINKPLHIHTPEAGFPRRIEWHIIAGSGVSEIQMYDVVFDTTDLRIRKMEIVNDQIVEIGQR